MIKLNYAIILYSTVHTSFFYLLIRVTLYDKLIQIIVNQSTFSNDANNQISSEQAFMQRTCLGKWHSSVYTIGITTR